jgi:transglutaminase-like putative cysteine protease
MNGGPRPTEEFLESTEVVDWQHPAVRAQAAALTRHGDTVATARSCFVFVRDNVKHSRDYRMDPATWRASDVLRHGTGYCYAKSHLLAALLRANGIPAGFCYQRLSVNDRGAPYCLHGYNAVWLPKIGWYRADARGNKPGVDAGFNPPVEQLAFTLKSADELDFENILPDPLWCVIDALQVSDGWEDVVARLPDVPVEQFESQGLRVRARGKRS